MPERQPWPQASKRSSTVDTSASQGDCVLSSCWNKGSSEGELRIEVQFPWTFPPFTERFNLNEIYFIITLFHVWIGSVFKIIREKHCEFRSWWSFKKESLSVYYPKSFCFLYLTAFCGCVHVWCSKRIFFWITLGNITPIEQHVGGEGLDFIAFATILI